MSALENIFNVTVTKGDSKTFIIEYTDLVGDPIDLTGWTFNATFKDRYNSDVGAFDLGWGEEIEFVGGLPQIGQVKFSILPAQIANIPIDLYSADEREIPSNTFIGDIKATAPIGSTLELVGNRPIVFLKVLARTTA